MTKPPDIEYFDERNKKQKADEELIAKILAGNASAFEALLQRYESLVRSAVKKVVEDCDEGNLDDLTQDVWLQVLRSLQTYHVRPGVLFSTWLFAVAKRKAIDFLRKRRGKQMQLLGEDFPEIASNDSSEAMDASSLIDERIQKAMGKLTEEEQEYIRLRCYGRLSSAEVATKMGLHIQRVYEIPRGIKRKLSDFPGGDEN